MPSKLLSHLLEPSGCFTMRSLRTTGDIPVACHAGLRQGADQAVSVKGGTGGVRALQRPVKLKQNALQPSAAGRGDRHDARRTPQSSRAARLTARGGRGRRRRKAGRRNPGGRVLTPRQERRLDSRGGLDETIVSGRGDAVPRP